MALLDAYIRLEQRQVMTVLALVPCIVRAASEAVLAAVTKESSNISQSQVIKALRSDPRVQCKQTADWLGSFQAELSVLLADDLRVLGTK